MNNEYELVVGLEIHCAVKSNSKVFSSSRNDYNEIPNINVNEVDLSFPGILPVVNKECVRKAIKMSHALGCVIPDELMFDRKNYYYPDLPKGYQITQVTKPIGTNGKVTLFANDKYFEVSIHDIHLEEDTASLDHFDDYTLIDYNRCGVPLIEIVTNPCFNTKEQVLAFLEYLSTSLKYTNVSEADTKKGQIRCDVNINLRKDGKYITPKVEIKNINSFSHIMTAIELEYNRQLDAYLNETEKLVQETRRFDEINNQTVRMRVKENSIDYKYFVEPNIPRIKLDQKMIEEIKQEVPMLPNERFKIYHDKYSLNENEAKTLIKDQKISNYFEKCVTIGINPKHAFNWISGNIIAVMNKNSQEIDELFVTPERLKEIIDNIESGNISSKQGKELFNLLLEEKLEVKELILKHGMKQLDNDDELTNIIDNLLKNNQNLIDDYHNGKTNIFGFFVGQIMKETKGKANPGKVNEILKSKLN